MKQEAEEELKAEVKEDPVKAEAIEETKPEEQAGSPDLERPEQTPEATEVVVDG